MATAKSSPPASSHLASIKDNVIIHGFMRAMLPGILFTGIGAFLLSFLFEVIIINLVVRNIFLGIFLASVCEFAKVGLIVLYRQVILTTDISSVTKAILHFLRSLMLGASLACTVALAVDSSFNPYQEEVRAEEIATTKMKWKDHLALKKENRLHEEERIQSLHDSQRTLLLQTFQEEKAKIEGFRQNEMYITDAMGNFAGRRYKELTRQLRVLKENYGNDLEKLNLREKGDLDIIRKNYQKVLLEQRDQKDAELRNYAQKSYVDDHRAQNSAITAFALAIEEQFGFPVTSTKVGFWMGVLFSIIIECIIYLVFDLLATAYFHGSKGDSGDTPSSPFGGEFQSSAEENDDTDFGIHDYSQAAASSDYASHHHFGADSLSPSVMENRDHSFPISEEPLTQDHFLTETAPPVTPEPSPPSRHDSHHFHDLSSPKDRDNSRSASSIPNIPDQMQYEDTGIGIHSSFVEEDISQTSVNTSENDLPEYHVDDSVLKKLNSDSTHNLVREHSDIDSVPIHDNGSPGTSHADHCPFCGNSDSSSSFTSKDWIGHA